METKTSKSGYDAVLLMAYGGPECLDQVRPFLQELFPNESPPESRVREIVSRYRAIGGGSLLTEQTRQQARALQLELRRRGIETPVRVGMRCWSPYICETLAELAASGAQRVFAIAMTPFESPESHGRYLESIEKARQKTELQAMAIENAPSFCDCAGFIRACADNLQEAYDEIAPERQSGAIVVFTAHSIPEASARRCRYAEQLHDCAKAVAEAAGVTRFIVAYQSRSGPPHESWLGPDLREVIEEKAEAGATAIVAAPLGFICDNLEVLYDLDIEAAALARKRNLLWRRAATVRDHPAFVAALADLIP